MAYVRFVFFCTKDNESNNSRLLINSRNSPKKIRQIAYQKYIRSITFEIIIGCILIYLHLLYFLTFAFIMDFLLIIFSYVNRINFLICKQDHHYSKTVLIVNNKELFIEIKGRVIKLSCIIIFV